VAVHAGERFLPQLVEQQPRGDIAVVRLALDQCPRCENGRQRQLRSGDAVIDVAMDLGEDGLGLDLRQARARLGDERFEARLVERRNVAIRPAHADLQRRTLGLDGGGGGTFAIALLAVEHVRARHLVVLPAHQRQLDLVLDLLDVECAPAIGAARQGGDDLL